MDLLKLLLQLMASTLALCYPTTMKKECAHHMMPGQSVDYLGTMMRQAEVKYITLRPTIRTFEECVELCCSNPQCDVALYNNLNKGNGLLGSCSLMKCHPLKSCAWSKTVTVQGAMIFRGKKMPTWPHESRVVRPDVKKIAKKPQRLRREADNNKAVKLQPGTIDTQAAAGSGSIQKKSKIPKNAEKSAPDQPNQLTKKEKKEQKKQQKQQMVTEQPNPQQRQAPEQQSQPQSQTTQPKVPAAPEAKAEAAAKKPPGPQLPKDAQTNQALSSPAHENPVTKPKTPDGNPPSTPNQRKMTTQDTQKEQANLTAIQQINSVVDKLGKNTAVPTSAGSPVPGATSTAAAPSEAHVDSGTGTEKQASDQSSSEEAASVPVKQAASSKGKHKDKKPEIKATALPIADVTDTAGTTSDGDEPLVVSPLYASTKPKTEAESSEVKAPAKEPEKDPDSALKKLILKRTTRSLTTEPGEGTNVTSPAQPEQTTVPATASEVEKLLGAMEKDNKDKKGNSSVHVNVLSTSAPNATQSPTNSSSSGNVTVHIVPGNTTETPASQTTSTPGNVTVVVQSNSTQTPANATATSGDATEQTVNATQTPASNATTTPSSGNVTVIVTNSTISPNGTDTPLNRTRPDVTDSTVNITTTEQPKNESTSGTTTSQPGSSTITPETTLQNQSTTSETNTTTMNPELASLLDKLLGTSSPPVETKTSQTKVTVTSDNKKTTISITSQNTTPVKPNNGNASEAQQDSEAAHSGVTANGSLVAALSFGCIFLFGVILLIGKRCYDGYQRRHYSKVDYLVNGMYN